MRIAAIDIGTNSTRLLVAEVVEQRVIPLCRDLRMTRLGKNVQQNRSLDHAAMKENAEVLAEFRKRAVELGAETILSVATSAVRDARNKDEFLSLVKSIAGIEVEVIPGVKEAFLSYTGVLAGLGRSSMEETLVCDIGGGSTELITGPQNAVSIDIGAVRLTEMFLVSDPPKEQEVASLREFVKDKLLAYQHIYSKYNKVIGVGGTITSLAAMEQEMEDYLPEKIQGFTLEKEAVKRQAATLCGLTLAQKRKLKGLQPKRADVILAGTLIIEGILDCYDFPSIVVSDSDILLGMIFEHLRLCK